MPREQIVQLARAWRLLVADDAHGLAPETLTWVHSAELAHQWIEVHLGRTPGLDDVVVQLSEGTALQDGRGGVPISQATSSARLASGSTSGIPTEQLDAGHLGHPLIGDHQGQSLSAGDAANHIVQRSTAGGMSNDAVVTVVAVLKGLSQGREGRLLVIHDDDERHLLHATRPLPPSLSPERSYHPCGS